MISGTIEDHANIPVPGGMVDYSGGQLRSCLLQIRKYDNNMPYARRSA
jgi:hypothetical protein